MQMIQEDCSYLMVENGFFPRDKMAQAKPFMIKGQWTLEEDQLLMSLVEQYGVKRWSHIARMLVGRVGKQCRERWHNHLRPNIKKEAWSEDEEKALVKAHADVGNKWAEIAKRIPGRTENSIKNHWNATKRRQISKRKCRKAGWSQNNGHPISILQEYMRSRGLLMEKSKEKPKKENKESYALNTSLKGKEKQCLETKENYARNALFPSLVKEDMHNMVSNIAGEQNYAIFEDMDLSCFFSWPSSSPPSSSAFVSGLQDTNLSLVIQEIPNELDTAKKELDLVEMVSSSVNMSDW